MAGPSAWQGFVAQGAGSTSTNGGLCMSVPEPGDNTVVWVSPERYIPLTDNFVYRVRVNAATDQITPDAIPLWGVLYDNFQSTGAGNNFGGESWFLDAAGGAEGIGRSEGRTQFDVYIAPNAVATDQWRGVVDPAEGAFSPAADANNDIRLALRVLDQGSGDVNADFDSGQICVTRLTVTGYPINDLAVESTAYAPPIANATHAKESLSEAAEGAGSATIDDATATAHYALTPSGPGARKSLLPFDPSQDNGQNFNRQLYPILWESDALYRGRMRIRSNAPGGVEGGDPVDAIFLAFDTPTVELGQVNYTTRGSLGNMHRAASPRFAATTGGVAQTYTAFFHGENVTRYGEPDANRFRFFGFFINNAGIGSDGLGTDPVAIESLEVDKLIAP